MVPSRLAAFLICVPVLASAQPFGASLDAEIGRNLFARSWVSAPSSTAANDGLGPLFDAVSCSNCHVSPNARIGEPFETPPGLVIRLGNAEGSGDPVYGHQLQTRAVQLQMVEGLPDISFDESDGLRRTNLTLHRLGYGELAAGTMAALRRPFRVEGVGVLARVSEAEILSRVVEDENQPGVSGRASWVGGANGERRLGRFGWRASQPDLAAQTEIAFLRVLGLSTSGQPNAWGECSEKQSLCRQAPHGAAPGEVEISDEMRDLIVDFLAALPAPRTVPSAEQGQMLFARLECGACHAILRLDDGSEVRAYTDLLLHDMGEGLHDGIREGAAAPGEWRTPPLWGIGATLRLGGLLHDGRARDVEEAVPWHDGEAAQSAAGFRGLTQEEKTALVNYVSGL
nr:MAG: hypothetical protein E4H34_02045 [Hyphomicrobiales bacterium]